MFSVLKVGFLIRKKYFCKRLKERLNYIDIARGFGILLVVFSHSGGEELFMPFVGGVFIPLFFILSGMTFVDRGQSLWEYAVRKLRRLLVPYLIFNLALLLFYRHFSTMDVLGVLYSRYCLYPFHMEENIFFMNSGNAPMWFLTALFTACLAFWALLRSGRYVWGMVVGYLLLTYILQFLPILLPWSIDSAFLFALFIFIGTKLRSLNLANIKGTYTLLLLVGYLFLCVFNGTPNLSVRVYAHSFLWIILTAVIGTLLILRLSQYVENTFLNSLMADIGRHSLTIFCVQMVFLRLENKLFFEVLNLPLTSFVIYSTSILKTILTAILGLYLSKILKRWFPAIF